MQRGCPWCENSDSPVIRRGFFPRRRAPGGRVQRYLCRGCRRTFSDQTLSPTYRERKPEVNQPVFRLLCTGVSERETAHALALHRRTVARKLVRMARTAAWKQALDLATRPVTRAVVFDEMETFEHSKCKPLAIAIAVEEKTRRILAMEVASMPAKGRLAALSRKKYGRRKDDRPAALRRLLTTVKAVAGETFTLKSDECPRYPKYVREILPGATHLTYKGRRGCVVGQGELKRGGFDPLFSLNHSCAMTRDRVKRLARRTWCTTKRPDRLQCLLHLMIYFHNQRLERPKRRVIL